ncbi:S8 family serine peptidase [Actinoplanes utahensis]|uniref:S8 family serine peptidase n=1 Tax=Actinoplanes utahensis TaxID=1869 RepID=UPI001377CC2B|nr:S8 family serine peptidase [Actinoplanes utahensis]GIF33312.1 hypothetical protein Aut01nite_62980 [Actinoplanes utahensis]
MSNHPRRRRGLRNRVLAACAALAVTVAAAPPAAAAEPVSQRQWFLAAVKARTAHKITKGTGVIVAVIGSGVDSGHPDLAGAVLPGMGFGGAASRTGRTDPDGTGTRAAGIIAARGGAEQALGIAPRARILPVAVGAAGTASLAQPIRWAVDHGAKVISITVPGRQPSTGSAGPVSGPQVPAEEAAAIAYALAKDVIVVTGADRAGEPARIPGVIAVSGITRAGAFWTASASGPQVALAAPAEGVLSTTARQVDAGGYSTATSAANATAIVSGVAALLRAKFPRMRAADIGNRLLRTATDRGAAGRDDLYGFGVVDAERALTARVPAVAATPAVPTPAPDAAAAPPGGDAATGTGLLDTPWGRFGLVLAIGAVLLSVLAGGVLLVARASVRRSPPWPPAPQQPGPVAGRPPTGPAGDW